MVRSITTNIAPREFPLATVVGPGGSSTNPSVPIREVKSPEPRVGFSIACRCPW
jgi:hypothetical protein